jgi:hypothetical protein
MLCLSKAIVINYDGDESILFRNAALAISKLKDNLRKETLPQFLSYFFDNEQQIATVLFNEFTAHAEQTALSHNLVERTHSQANRDLNNEYHIVLNVIPHSVVTAYFNNRTTIRQMSLKLRDKFRLEECDLIINELFDNDCPASELKSSKYEPLFFVPLNWGFGYKGKFTVSITLLFLTKWLDLLSAHKMLNICVENVEIYDGDKSILFFNTIRARRKLKDNLRNETLPQFLSYFSDNEKKIAYELFRAVCPESNQIFPFKIPFNSIFKHS